MIVGKVLAELKGIDMKSVELENRPKILKERCAILDYQIASVYIRTTVDIQPTDDKVMLRARAFQVTKKGVFMVGNDGAPITNPVKISTITRIGLGDISTFRPAWVRVPLAEGQVAYRKDSQTVSLKIKPEDPPLAGREGAWVDVAGILFRWDEGILDSVAKSQALSLAQQLAATDIPLVI